MAASHQYLYKPLKTDGTTTAVFMMNSDSTTQTLTLNVSDVPGMKGPCDNARDIWEHKDLGKVDELITVDVDSHDAAFLVLSGCQNAPTPPPPAIHKIVNPTSGKCVDIYNNDFSDEAKVQLYQCNGGANQEWQLLGDAIVNPASGKCLDIYNHDGLSPDKYKDETKVELYSCNGNPNQKWQLVNGQLVNPPSGKCLDIYNPDQKPSSLTNEAPLQLFTCSQGKINQAWEIQDAATVI